MDSMQANNGSPSVERFQIIGPGDLEDYRQRAGEIAEACWPEFMLQDPIANENWDELFDSFPDFQFALLDVEAGRMAAMGNSVPFHWDDALTELPEGGWDWVLETAVDDHRRGANPNIQSAIQIAVHPNYQRQGLSSKMVHAMRRIGQRRGFEYLVAPVRPSQKGHYPLIGIDDYITWRNLEGLPFDAWLRVHERLGARILKPCHEAMTIGGSRLQWQAWTGMQFPQTGHYVIPGALHPMHLDVEQDRGVYVEPNVWMVHDIRAAA